MDIKGVKAANVQLLTLTNYEAVVEAAVAIALANFIRQ